MKILYDHQIFSTQYFGGISRYFYELMNCFKKDAEVDYEVALKYTHNQYLKNSDKGKYCELLGNIRFKGKRRLQYLINQHISRVSIKKQKFDILHPTYYDPYMLKAIRNKPLVLTIYDMIHEIFPELFGKQDRTSEKKRVLAEKAAKIIAISETTKKDIIRFYHLDESVVTVVPLGYKFQKRTSEGIASRIRLPEKYILYVGERYAYKNFRPFIKTLAKFISSRDDLYIVCAGGGNFTQEERHLFKTLKLSDRIKQWSVNDDMLALLYKQAAVFIFPSLYEGFGLPVLEAFANECPVLVSRVGSLPEVAGDAALYFNPKDGSSIESSVNQIINNDNLRREIVAKGIARLKRFTWEKTAEATKGVYQSIK